MSWWTDIRNFAENIALPVLGVIAVVATAGAAAPALFAAEGAGVAAAASFEAGVSALAAESVAAVNAAATTAIMSAAAADTAVAAVVTGSAEAAWGAMASDAVASVNSAAAISGAADTAAAGVGVSEGAAAAGISGSTAAGAGLPMGEMPVSPGTAPIDPSIPTPDIASAPGSVIPTSIPKYVTDAAKSAAIKAGVSGAIGAATGGSTGSADTSGASTGMGVAGTLGVTAAAAAGLASFNGGNSDLVANPQLTSSMNSLTGNGDAQMAAWNNYMFPSLKDGLASDKSATDAYVSQSNTDAGTMRGQAAQAGQAASDYLARNKSVYIPQADKIIADANAFSKEGYGAQQAGLAIGDLESAYAAQRTAQQQQMAQYGIDPTSGRSMAMQQAGSITNSANEASAATRARAAAEEIWGTKQMNALNTSTALNTNANTYDAMMTSSNAGFTNADALQNSGVTASNNYLTNAGNVSKAQDGAYGAANTAYSNAATNALGLSKLQNDRYIAEQQGRGTVIGSGLQALGSAAGGTSGIGSAVGGLVTKAGNAIGDGLGSLASKFTGSSSPVASSADYSNLDNLTS